MESYQEEPGIHVLLLISSVVQQLQNIRKDMQILTGKEKQLILQLQKLVSEASNKTKPIGGESYEIPDILKVDYSPPEYSLEQALSPPQKAKLRRQKHERKLKQSQEDAEMRPENVLEQAQTSKRSNEMPALKEDPIPTMRKLIWTQTEESKNKLDGDLKLIQTEKDEKTPVCLEVSAAIVNEQVVETCSAASEKLKVASVNPKKTIATTPLLPDINQPKILAAIFNEQVVETCSAAPEKLKVASVNPKKTMVTTPLLPVINQPKIPAAIVNEQVVETCAAAAEKLKVASENRKNTIVTTPLLPAIKVPRIAGAIVNEQVVETCSAAPERLKVTSVNPKKTIATTPLVPAIKLPRKPNSSKKKGIKSIAAENLTKTEIPSKNENNSTITLTNRKLPVPVKKSNKKKKSSVTEKLLEKNLLPVNPVDNDSKTSTAERKLESQTIAQNLVAGVVLNIECSKQSSIHMVKAKPMQEKVLTTSKPKDSKLEPRIVENTCKKAVNRTVKLEEKTKIVAVDSQKPSGTMSIKKNLSAKAPVSKLKNMSKLKTNRIRMKNISHKIVKKRRKFKGDEGKVTTIAIPKKKLYVKRKLRARKKAVATKRKLSTIKEQVNLTPQLKRLEGRLHIAPSIKSIPAVSDSIFRRNDGAAKSMGFMDTAVKRSTGRRRNRFSSRKRKISFGRVWPNRGKISKSESSFRHIQGEAPSKRVTSQFVIQSGLNLPPDTVANAPVDQEKKNTKIELSFADDSSQYERHVLTNSQEKILQVSKDDSFSCDYANNKVGHNKSRMEISRPMMIDVLEFAWPSIGISDKKLEETAAVVKQIVTKSRAKKKSSVWRKVKSPEKVRTKTKAPRTFSHKPELSKGNDVTLEIVDKINIEVPDEKDQLNIETQPRVIGASPLLEPVCKKYQMRRALGDTDGGNILVGRDQKISASEPKKAFKAKKAMRAPNVNSPGTQNAFSKEAIKPEQTEKTLDSQTKNVRFSIGKAVLVNMTKPGKDISAIDSVFQQTTLAHEESTTRSDRIIVDKLISFDQQDVGSNLNESSMERSKAEKIALDSWNKPGNPNASVVKLIGGKLHTGQYLKWDTSPAAGLHHDGAPRSNQFSESMYSGEDQGEKISINKTNTVDDIRNKVSEEKPKISITQAETSDIGELPIVSSGKEAISNIISKKVPVGHRVSIKESLEGVSGQKIVLRESPLIHSDSHIVKKNVEQFESADDVLIEAKKWDGKYEVEKCSSVSQPQNLDDRTALQKRSECTKEIITSNVPKPENEIQIEAAKKSKDNSHKDQELGNEADGTCDPLSSKRIASHPEKDAATSAIEEQLPDNSKMATYPAFQNKVGKAIQNKQHRNRSIPNKIRLSKTDIFDPCDSSSNIVMNAVPLHEIRELPRDVPTIRGTKRKQVRSIRKYRKRRLV